MQEVLKLCKVPSGSDAEYDVRKQFFLFTDVWFFGCLVVWLFGALSLLSRVLVFPPAARLLSRVDNMLEYVRESFFHFCVKLLGRIIRKRFLARFMIDLLAFNRAHIRNHACCMNGSTALVDRRLFSTCQIGLHQVFVLFRCSC